MEQNYYILSKKCICSDGNSQQVILNLNDNKFYELNGVSSFLIGLLQKKQTISSLLASAKNKYSFDVEDQIIKEEIKTFLKNALLIQIVEKVSSSEYS